MKIKNKELLYNQICSLIDTMEIVRQNESRFEMDVWVRNYDSACGTVACILGWHAVIGDMTYFKGATYKKQNTNSCDKSIAIAISDELSLNCEEIACSIYLEENYDRYDWAYNTGMFTFTELGDIPFMCDGEPIAEDAIDYMHILLGKLGELK